MKQLKHAALAALLVCAAGAASAQASASISASVVNFGYTLTDLDPNDGITPTLTWTQLVSQSSAQTSTQDPGTSPWPTYSSSGSGNQINLSGSDSSVLLSGASAGTSATTAFSSAAAEAGGNQQFAGSAQGGYFTLSANTAATFTADIYLSASGALLPGTPPLTGTDWSYYHANGQAFLGVWVNGSDTSPGTLTPFVSNNYPEALERIVQIGVSSSTEDQSAQQGKQVSLTFRNTAGSAGAYSVGVLTDVSAYTVAPAIPEPGTWVLTAIGLGAAGWAGRRRARRTGG